MSRVAKEKVVEKLSQDFKNAQIIVLTEYRGLTVKEISELRRLMGTSTKYAVVKNTLTKLAASKAGIEGFNEFLEGPSALAFGDDDPVVVAKSLKNFSKEHNALIIKGAYMDGSFLSKEELSKLAELESREVLLAKLAGAMNAPASQVVYVVAALLQKAAQLMKAYEETKQAE